MNKIFIFLGFFKIMENKFRELEKRLIAYFENSQEKNICKLLSKAHSLVDKYLVENGFCKYDGKSFLVPLKSLRIYAKAHLMVNEIYRYS